MFHYLINIFKLQTDLSRADWSSFGRKEYNYRPWEWRDGGTNSYENLMSNNFRTTAVLKKYEW